MVSAFVFYYVLGLLMMVKFPDIFAWLFAAYVMIVLWNIQHSWHR